MDIGQARPGPAQQRQPTFDLAARADVRQDLIGLESLETASGPDGDPSPCRAAFRRSPAKLPIVDETDKDAVGFYSANHFVITSLGEKYPGIERLRLHLDALADTGDRPST
jgi:hypothetical protein